MKTYTLSKKYNWAYLLMMLLAISLLLNACYTDLDCEGCDKDEISSISLADCSSDASKIILSLEELRVACQGGEDCLVRYNDKMEIIPHLAVEPNQATLDPAYLGFFLYSTSNLKIPGHNCNEPPPRGGGGIQPKPGSDFELSSHTGSEAYFEVIPCNDLTGSRIAQRFIGITILDISFEKAIAHYTGINCQSDYFVAESDQLPLACSEDTNEITWENGINSPKFTTKVFHVQEAIYYTLIKTGVVGKTMRIAYKDPGYLEGRFIFE